MRPISLCCVLLMLVGCGSDAGGSAHMSVGDGGNATPKDSGSSNELDGKVPDLDSGEPKLDSGANEDSGMGAADAAALELCNPDTCQNGGTCSASEGGASCLCAAGWEGKTCAQNVDECASAGCVHATGCTDALNDFSCACENGWKGKICDQDIDECAANPCQHATSCDNQTGDYVCNCETGWFGKNCDVYCDDGDAGTTDTLHPVYGCAHRKQDWTTFDKGIYADHTTGLGWWQNSGSIGYAEIKVACAELDKAGLSDWRLPTINETRSLGGGCPKTASGGTCTISDPTCLDEDCGYGFAGECSSCIGGPGGTATHPYGYCRADVTLCSNWWTSSVCSDCATEHVWFYGVTNGNFYHDSPTGGRSGACVTVLPEL